MLQNLHQALKNLLKISTSNDNSNRWLLRGFNLTLLRQNPENNANNSGKTPEHVEDDPDKKVAVNEYGFPEEPTTCCMSGCANCIWLDYAEKLSNYYKDGGEKAVAEINEKITDPSIKAFLLHELRMRNK